MIQVISNRDNMVAEPWRSARLDPLNTAVIIETGLRQAGLPARWVPPTAAFSSAPLLGWNVLTPQPIRRNGEVGRFLMRNRESENVLLAGVASVSELPRILGDRLVKMVCLSREKLHAATGIYDTERALRKLSILDPRAVIVVTNQCVAYAAQDGQISREITEHVPNAAWADGKSAAFFAGFFATWFPTQDLRRSLVAGHVNAAGVATSFSAVDALLNGPRLEAAVERRLNQRAGQPAPRQTAAFAAAAGWVVSSITSVLR